MKLIRRVSALAAGLVLAASAFVPQAAAESQAPDPAWEKFASARRVFQVRLCELASRRWPEFSSFFADHRDLQLAYLERRNLAFYRLMAVDPARIVRTEGGQRFLGFVWTSEEDRQFQEAVPGYAQVTGEIGKLKAKDALTPVQEMLSDPDDELIVLTVIDTLGAIGERKANASLIRLLSNSDEAIRSGAQRALGKLSGGKDFGTNKRAWEDWFSRNP